MLNTTPYSDVSFTPLGRFHTWWGDEKLPVLPALPELTIAPAPDSLLLTAVSGIDAREIERRKAQGHASWMAWLPGEPVGWGWCATRELAIGELGLSCALPPRQRYLWDFFTNPRWRGHGIYPRLLQTIVAHEPEGVRFWVGHDFDNAASARGIAKAGFQEVGVLYRMPDQSFALVPCCAPEVAAGAAARFGVPLVDSRANGALPAGSDR